MPKKGTSKKPPLQPDEKVAINTSFEEAIATIAKAADNSVKAKRDSKKAQKNSPQ